jgi:hypothetical protein
MRAFVYMPSKRRVATGLVVALLVLSAFTAVHHHRLDAEPQKLAFALLPDGQPHAEVLCVTGRALDHARELIPEFAAPQLVVSDCMAIPDTPPAPSAESRPSSPRAPPAAA